MKIWITGIAGFLGSHLADALIADGHEVSGNDSLICGSSDNIPFNARSVSYVDCCNFDSLYHQLADFRPDVVVHCAATAHEGLSSFSPSFITRNIYEASVATFSAAIAAGAKHIVYMSSMSRYGNNAPPFTEDMQPKPVDPYAVAKVAAEDTLKILAKTHRIAYTILVPHNIIGIRQRYCDPYRNVASIMINRCLQGKAPIVYGDGLQKRCFSPIADCLPSIIRAIHGDADGEVVNIGPDAGEITILDLANKIIRMTGLNAEPIHMPDRPNEVKHAYCSSDKARHLLQYKSMQSIDDCLMEMIEDIRRRGTKEFEYSFPLEILSDRTPKTWKDRLI